MRNDLTKENNLNQSGVINLDEKDGPGTHWTAYKKNKTQIIYFQLWKSTTTYGSGEAF